MRPESIECVDDETPCPGQSGWRNNRFRPANTRVFALSVRFVDFAPHATSTPRKVAFATVNTRYTSAWPPPLQRSTTSSTSIPSFCAARAAAASSRTNDGFRCPSCSQTYRAQDDIPSLFAPNEWDDTKEDVTEKIKAFYEANPFPNYDDFDSAGSLIDKARDGLFAKLLDEQIPYGARVIECGCGTGQLTNFLSIAQPDGRRHRPVPELAEDGHGVQGQNDLDSRALPPDEPVPAVLQARHLSIS